MGARSRRLHSTVDETKGETRRSVPCVNCIVHLANWEGPDEGPRPLCVHRASGVRRCGRCYANNKKCLQIPATALQKVKALEEVAKKTFTDSNLVSAGLYLLQKRYIGFN